MVGSEKQKKIISIMYGRIHGESVQDIVKRTEQVYKEKLEKERNGRRMNSAMTRAKRKLVVIGDSDTLGSHAFYRNFLEYCERHEAYGSAWEWTV